MLKAEKKLRQLLNSYSFDDLACSFFALNLWLPNVGSPIKFEYLYSVLESIGGGLPKDNRVLSFRDFESLCSRLIVILPNCSMLEDYLPESDWGEIKYYFANKAYRIFYGASLSNPYEFYSAFEVCHLGLEEDYMKAVNRSPSREFEFCLKLQDYLINSIDQSNAPRDRANSGYLEVPEEWFWAQATDCISTISKGVAFHADLLQLFSHAIRPGEEQTLPDLATVLSRSVLGQNCAYFFLESDGRHYPVMPRKYLSVLCDTWGTLLKQQYDNIRKINERVDGTMEMYLSKYIQERTKDDDVFGLVTAMESKTQYHELTFAAAIHADDRLYLIHLIPVSEFLAGLDGYMQRLVPRLSRARELLSTFPTRIGVKWDRSVAEFHANESGRTLQPVFIVTTPYLSTAMQTCRIPEEFDAHLVPIDQLLGLIDEFEDSSEMARFFDFRAQLTSETNVFALTSYLDLYGSFKDSHAVLLEGATKPTHVYIDPHWGTGHRFQTLAKFWTVVPDISFIGHPRSWMFPKDGPPKALLSRRFRGYAHFETVGKAVFFLNCPLDQLTRSEWNLTDLLLLSLRDALTLHTGRIKGLAFAGAQRKIQVFCAPASAAKRSDQLEHLRPLIPTSALWTASIVRIRHDDIGISIVFDEDKLTESLLGASDRSIQIDLLLTILQELQELWPDAQLATVSDMLQLERSKANRFRLHEQAREVTFPEYAPNILPGPTEYKLADQFIAKLASEHRIEPGEYENAKANDILKKLRKSFVAKIDESVAQCNFEQGIPILLSGIDSLVHNHEAKGVQVRESLDQEVEYDRSSALSEDQGEFLHDHQTYRYLIEKFVQLTPHGDQQLTNPVLIELLARAERLLNLYAASDAVHYGIVPAKLKIDHDFVVKVEYEQDSKAKEHAFGIEKANIQLGLVGRLDDTPEPPGRVQNYLDELGAAFLTDFAFGLRNLVNILHILSLWAAYRNVTEATHYSATAEEIAETCLSHIRHLDSVTVKAVLEFLTLRPEEVNWVEGHPLEEPDIPVWEYTKRRSRYTVKPLILVGSKFFWGPYSTNKAASLWMDVPHLYKLPISLQAPAVKRILLQGHRALEAALETKVAEITGRFCEHIKTGLFPHDYDRNISNIGDYDTFGYNKERGIILNVESKIIDPPRCLKDARRLRETIFGRYDQNHEWVNEYLQKVEVRHEYLKTNAAKIITDLNWDKPTEPLRVVSIFVTQVAFWWTRFPPVETEVYFVECRMLNDFLQKLVK